MVHRIGGTIHLFLGGRYLLVGLFFGRFRLLNILLCFGKLGLGIVQILLLVLLLLCGRVTRGLRGIFFGFTRFGLLFLPILLKLVFQLRLFLAQVIIPLFLGRFYIIIIFFLASRFGRFKIRFRLLGILLDLFLHLHLLRRLLGFQCFLLLGLFLSLQIRLLRPQLRRFVLHLGRGLI